MHLLSRKVSVQAVREVHTQSFAAVSMEQDEYTKNIDIATLNFIVETLHLG